MVASRKLKQGLVFRWYEEVKRRWNWTDESEGFSQEDEDYILNVLVLKLKGAVWQMKGVFLKKSKWFFKLWCGLLRLESRFRWWEGGKDFRRWVFVPTEWQHHCKMWNMRCYWLAGFAVFCSDLNGEEKNSSPVLKVQCWKRWFALNLQRNIPLIVVQGAKPNRTALCLFVVVSSRHNGLCVWWRWAAPATAMLSSVCCHPLKLERHTVKDFFIPTCNSWVLTWADRYVRVTVEARVSSATVKKKEGKKLESHVLTSSNLSSLCSL